MSNRRRARPGRRHQPSPEGRKPVTAYTADQLHTFLVTDAVNQHATDLPWYVLAIRRIAELEHCSVEAAHLRVEGEVYALTGRGMPVYSGPIIGGPR